MNTLEQDLTELRALVDGQQPWSVRKRLHAIESERHAAELLLRELRRRSNRFREWGSFVIAIAALVIAILLKTHGGH